MNDKAKEKEIDLLVAGELDELTRKELIHWMEEEPTRWRLCGLAFLEAQLWRESFDATDQISPIPMSMLPQPSLSKTLSTAQSPSAPKRRSFSWGTLAASALVAFSLGWWSKQPSSTQSMNEKDMATISTQPRAERQPSIATVRQSEDVSTKSSIQQDLVSAEALTGQKTTSVWERTKISNYERQLLARQGIELTMERNYVHARQVDGSLLAVPVDRVIAKLIQLKVN